MGVWAKMTKKKKMSASLWIQKQKKVKDGGVKSWKRQVEREVGGGEKEKAGRERKKERKREDDNKRRKWERLNMIQLPFSQF